MELWKSIFKQKLIKRVNHNIINKIIPFLLLIVIQSSCTKYVANSKANSNTINNQQQGGYTPLPGSGSTGGSGTSNSGNSNSGSSSTDSVDAVYAQGFYLLDISKQITSTNQTTNQSIILNANGYYTKFYMGYWNFWNPYIPPQNHSDYLAHFAFTKNGFYSIISNSVNPGFILLQNGNMFPSTTKAYIRFLNICDSADAVSINTKISSSNDVAYFSYRKPYDIYNTSPNGVRESIANQNYNTNFTNFTSVNSGVYNIEVYLNNGKSFNRSFTFSAGKKYSIIVSQKSLAQPIEYYTTILQHN